MCICIYNYIVSALIITNSHLKMSNILNERYLKHRCSATYFSVISKHSIYYAKESTWTASICYSMTFPVKSED